MNKIVILTCLLAVSSVVQGQDKLIERYMEYLMKYMQQCAAESKLTDEQLREVQMGGDGPESSTLGCMRSCVMKKMDALKDNKVQLEPINKMIEIVHAGDDAGIAKVKQVAADCAKEVDGETEECKLGLRYTDCYLARLMNP